MEQPFRSQLGEPLRSWVLDSDLDRYRVDGPVHDASTWRRCTTIAGGVAAEVRADYLDSYAGDRFVESMRYVHSFAEELPALSEVLPRMSVPVTIVNGQEHDRVVPVENAEFLHERLPDSRLELVDAGHFVWEEMPAQYASIILESIAATG